MLLASEEITAWIGSYLWTLFRITALIAAAPVIGSRTVPVRVKLMLSMALTIVVVPMLPATPSVEPLSLNAVLITLHQILIGLAMGLTFKLVFTMFVVGGQVIAYQMGLGFSQMVDPQSGTQVPVVSQFYLVIITLLFFTFNGHLIVIEVLIKSFILLPIATTGISPDGYWHIIEWSKQMFIGGISMAFPAIGSIFLINFTFGIVTRSAPQFNIFSIGFPITIVMGFFIIMVTISTVMPHLTHQFDAAINVIYTFLEMR